MLEKSLGKRYDAWYMLFDIYPRTQKFWHAHVIARGDFMVIDEPWIGYIN